MYACMCMYSWCLFVFDNISYPRCSGFSASPLRTCGFCIKNGCTLKSRIFEKNRNDLNLSHVFHLIWFDLIRSHFIYCFIFVIWKIWSIFLFLPWRVYVCMMLVLLFWIHLANFDEQNTNNNYCETLRRVQMIEREGEAGI